ncbi:MAG: hypothetical protein IKF38_01935 [Clostridia bacterium]|nr:hypothetical protein [Clostridia bacterium]
MKKNLLKSMYEKWITPKYELNKVRKVIAVFLIILTGPKMMWASWDTVLFWIVFDVVLMILASRAMINIAEWDNHQYKQYMEKNTSNHHA